MFTFREQKGFLNEGALMNLHETERRLLDEALQALETQTGGAVKLLRRQHGTIERGFDAQVELKLHGQKMLLLAEIKNVDRRPALAPIKAQLETVIKRHLAGYLPLLVTPYMTEAMAEECRRLNLPFVDTAGNLFVRTGTTYLYIIGRPRPAHIGRQAQKAITPAGMKILFALLCKPDLAWMTYRQIGAAAQVALGAVGPVLQDLETRGFLRRPGKGPAALERAEELLREWVVQYPAILRPKLNARRYTADRNRILGLDLKPLGAYWGGEVAAERLTGYLKAEHLLVYTRGAVKELLIQGRMRLAADGDVEVLDAFWNPELDRMEKPLAPSLLVYADLMMTGDSRNLETAKVLYEQYLQPAAATR
jgi:hypothetical protein